MPGAREFAEQWVADHQPEPLKCDKCGTPMSIFSSCAMPSGTAWMDQCKVGGMHSYTITVRAADDHSVEIENLTAALEAYAETLKSKE